MDSDLRVYATPTVPKMQKESHSGIAQVILNVARYTPEFNIEFVEDEAEAHIVAAHAGSTSLQNDVAHIHGLYPTGEKRVKTERWQHEVNQRVIDSIMQAYQVTVPSEWVADILRREFHLQPHVIGWGANHIAHPPKKRAARGNYVLWNKNRTEGVCNTEPLDRFVAASPHLDFVSTFGTPRSNIKLTGRVPHEQMQTLLANAVIYLATTKETGDIGSREALALGVPVLGFRHGAITDFVEHGVNGYLVEPDDIAGLKQGAEWILQHWETLSYNAVLSVRNHAWRTVARRFSEVYWEAYRQKTQAPKVSIVIPCYNYGHFVEEAIASACAQTVPCEVIVVNDGSTDDSLERIIALRNRYKFCLIDQQNAGVAHARNNGIMKSEGDFIVCLDADDKIAPNFVEVCLKAITQSRRIGIAYTSLQTVNGHVSSAFPPFNAERHFQGANQVPTCCLFRKEAWQRAGGYRQRFHPAEDARLWTDIVELGYSAKKATEEALFIYRDTHASATRGASALPIKSYLFGKGYLQNGDWPLTLGGNAYDYDQPLISIITPVGSGHEKYLQEAMDSVKGQTFKNWEHIIVNDTGRPLRVPAYARMVDMVEGKSAAKARNAGLKIARGQLVVFLDADDIILPTFLDETLKLYNQTGRYIYTDWSAFSNGELTEHQSGEFSPTRCFQRSMYHTITALLPREWVQAVGGFDESLASWEDLDLYLKMHVQGYCGQRLPKNLFVYRMHTGQLRERAVRLADDLKKLMLAKHTPAYQGKEDKDIMCSCGKRTPQALEPSGEFVTVIYTPSAGYISAYPHTGRVLIRGQKTKHIYGNRKEGETIDLLAEDYAVMPHDIFRRVTVKDYEITPTPPPDAPSKIEVFS